MRARLLGARCYAEPFPDLSSTGLAACILCARATSSNLLTHGCPCPASCPTCLTPATLPRCSDLDDTDLESEGESGDEGRPQHHDDDESLPDLEPNMDGAGGSSFRDVDTGTEFGMDVSGLACMAALGGRSGCYVVRPVELAVGLQAQHWVHVARF